MEKKKNRKQFNVYLDRHLIREIKHACIEEDVRLNHLVEEILGEYLSRRGRTEVGLKETGMTVFYMTDQYDALCAFYEIALGIPGKKGKNWCAYSIAPNAVFALHRVTETQHGDKDTAKFGFHFGNLEAGVRAFTEAGATVEDPIVDVAYGRSAKVRDPEDRLVELDEYDRRE